MGIGNPAKFKQENYRLLSAWQHGGGAAGDAPAHRVSVVRADAPNRVGGNAQTEAMKKVAGSLRLDLAAFRELEAFAQLGTDLDAGTQRQLDRGYRMVEILKQPQYSPLKVEEQVVVIYAGVKGYLDGVEVGKIRAFEEQFLNDIRSTGSDILDAIRTEKVLSEATETKLKAFLDKFAKTFA